MKRFNVKKVPLIWCASMMFCFSSCKIDETRNEKYPELPPSVAEKLIKEDLARKLSEGYVYRIQKLQGLENTVREYSDVAEKEQETTQSEALKAIYSNETHPPFELSASSYYTLEELESYIEFAKREAAKQNVTLDGFRIYMGLFPDDPKFEDKQNFLTVFISPTGKSGTQKGEMFTLMNETSSDLTSVGCLEYGGHGDPPSSSFPN